MILYESATVLHGRQFPLEGEFYDNIFFHFRPVQYHSVGNIADSRRVVTDTLDDL